VLPSEARVWLRDRALEKIERAKPRFTTRKGDGVVVKDEHLLEGQEDDLAH